MCEGRITCEQREHQVFSFFLFFRQPRAGGFLYAWPSFTPLVCVEAMYLMFKDAIRMPPRRLAGSEMKTRGDQSEEEEDEAGCWRVGCREGELEGQEGGCCTPSRGVREVRWACSPRWLLGRARAFDTRWQLGQQCLLHELGVLLHTYGWQMGKISGIVSNATPKLVKKLNYRILDGIAGAGQAASRQYGHGAHARYDSWLTCLWLGTELKRHAGRPGYPLCISPCACGTRRLSGCAETAEMRLGGCNYSRDASCPPCSRCC